MDTPPMDDEPCEQCGLCCRIFGPADYADPGQCVRLDRTEPGGYPAMVCRVHVEWQYRELRRDFCGRSSGMPSPLRCVTTESGEYVTVCPFLRRVAKMRYRCGIHTVKPEMCCNYQPWVWGETHFNRCPALKRADRKCRRPF